MMNKMKKKEEEDGEEKEKERRGNNYWKNKESEMFSIRFNYSQTD